MTQDDYVVMKKISREKLIKELKECKKENKQLKKQKDDVVEYIKNRFDADKGIWIVNCYDLLRMLGEIDD